jgi:hypothetical protein
LGVGVCSGGFDFAGNSQHRSAKTSHSFLGSSPSFSSFCHSVQVFVNRIRSLDKARKAIEACEAGYARQSIAGQEQPTYGFNVFPAGQKSQGGYQQQFFVPCGCTNFVHSSSSNMARNSACFKDWQSRAWYPLTRLRRGEVCDGQRYDRTRAEPIGGNILLGRVKFFFLQAHFARLLRLWR